MSDFWINIFIRTDANLNRPKPTFSNQQPDIPNSLECCSQFTPWPFSLRWMYITPDLIGFSLLEISPSTFPLWVTLGITLEIIGPTDPLYRLIVTTCQGRGGLNYFTNDISSNQGLRKISLWCSFDWNFKKVMRVKSLET